jgi:DNA-binding transcriptional LysR family regulator
MDITTHMQTFVEVVHHGGFSEAARHLGVVPSVVARRIAQLELELQARLFERTTRKITLTEAGERLHARAAGVVTQFQELLQEVRRDDGKPEGRLRVMAPTTLAMEQLGSVFCAFLAAHPRITMELSLFNGSANPSESGFDLSISGRAASYENVVDVPLCPIRSSLCASPAYVQAHGEPQHPRDLSKHACLVFTASNGWSFHSSRGKLTVDVPPRLLADDNRTLQQAALQGLGIALLPAYLASAEIASGRLRTLLPKFTPEERWFKAFVPRRKLGLARVQALLQFLQTEWAQTVE